MKFSLLSILFYFLIISSLTGQSENDSTRLEYDIKLKIPLTLKNLNNYPQYLILNNSTDFSLPVYYGYPADEMNSSIHLDMKKINSQLLQDFKQHMTWQKKQDLGVIGQYLGYAMGAAAAGLAISHIVRYKDQAMIFK